MPGGLDRLVHAPAGEVADLHDRGVAREHPVGGADGPGGVELGGHRVDGDDRMGAGEGRRHDRGDADPAQTDDGHGLARADLRRIEDRTGTGEHSTAEDGGRLERHGAGDGHERAG